MTIKQKPIVKPQQQLVLQTIRHALFASQLSIDSLTEAKFASALKCAKEQTVQGLFCASLDNKNVSLTQHDAIQTFLTLESVRKTNEKINFYTLQLTALLKKNNIKFFIVKGQTLAALYPRPDARLAGDIDFYCYPEDVDKTIKILTDEWHVNINRGESNQHYAFTHNGIPFELHFCLFHFVASQNSTYFNHLLRTQPLSQIQINHSCIPTLNPTMNLIFTFLHLFHHLIELGIGLRQFCDVAILCHRTHAQINNALLTEILDRLDFTSAFKAIGTLLVDHLDLPANEFPLPLTKHDRRKTPYILRIVFKRGNFGQYGRTTAVRSGLGYYIEQSFIKLSHYFHLYSLAPTENKAVLTKEIPSKILHLPHHTK
ncbi:MAG: nucleotidyltransferase family protein [Prevotella micans]|nr:nucleotidyltransferase family protein [Prevotella micans]